MTTTDTIVRPALTLAGAVLVLLAAMGLLGCSAPVAVASSQTEIECAGQLHQPSKFEQDRRAILSMAGQFDVSFDFKETLALRAGYALKDPYRSQASELVLVIRDEPALISLQHLLLVEHDGKTHIVKHWRQDWQYQGDQGYDYLGDNTWTPISFDAQEVPGAWVQSVYQVDDSPRYWGIGRWVHREGVSTWSAPTNRPLPRREHTQRDDYQVLGAVNTHVVTDAGWMHFQSNHKLDTHAQSRRVIALESGVNTYTKTTTTDFSKAYDYWDNTSSYWGQVRAAWADVYGQGEVIELRNRVGGEKLYTHIMDLADEYWSIQDASTARVKIDEVIRAFRGADRVAQP